MTVQSPARRTRLLAGALLLATFAAGALVGMASQQVLSANEPDRSEERRDRSRGHSLFGPEGRLTQRLGLTEDQRARIDSILAADRQKADSIFDEMKPRLRARYDSTTSALRAVMTPEQQAEFDRYRQERRARAHKRYGGDDRRRGDDGR